eukprot:gene3778-4357_t
MDDCVVETNWTSLDYADAVVFDVSKLQLSEPGYYPTVRKFPKQLFVGFSVENPSYYPTELNQTFLDQTFNITGSYRFLDSDSHITIGYGPVPANSQKIQFDITAMKEIPKPKEKFVNFIQQNCHGFMGRKQIVEEIMALIQVDSMGPCLHNLNVTQVWGMVPWNTQKMDLIKDYTFTLALENTRCLDYVTEKLWQPMTVGSIPVYLGAPNVRDFLPHPDAAILIEDFKTVNDLVHYLKEVANNESLRYKHLKWITDPDRFTKWKAYNDSKKASTDIFCKICRNIKQVKETDKHFTPVKDSWLKCEGVYEIPVITPSPNAIVAPVTPAVPAIEAVTVAPVAQATQAVTVAPAPPASQATVPPKEKHTILVLDAVDHIYESTWISNYADAVVFDVSKLQLSEPGYYPTVRKFPKQLFVGFSVENPSYYPTELNQTFLDQTFNITGSYRFLDSDSHITIGYGPVPANSQKIQFDITAMKEIPKPKEKLVNFVQQNCGGFMGRKQIVEGIMELLDVDSMGPCLNNLNVTKVWGMVNWNTQKQELIKDYIFTLALENTRCLDYVTEKLWQPMTVGSIPVYLGAPNVRDFLPDPDAAILIEDFKTVNDLANYMIEVANNETLRYKHLKWITDPDRFTKWKAYNDSKKASTDIFCKICRNIKQVKETDKHFAPVKDSWLKCEGVYEIPVITHSPKATVAPEAPPTPAAV